MSIADIVIVAVLAVAVAAAVICMIIRKRGGKCSCGCENCNYKCERKL